MPDARLQGVVRSINTHQNVLTYDHKYGRFPFKPETALVLLGCRTC